jgi:hypothetical protein
MKSNMAFNCDISSSISILGYDMTHNAFYLKNSPAAGAADTFAIRTTNTARAPISVSTAIDKK